MSTEYVGTFINKYITGFDQLRIICKCVSKDATRYAINYLYVEAGRVTGCNGHVLACIDNIYSIKPGFYTVKKNNKKEIILDLQDAEHCGKYPKIDDLIEYNTPVKGDVYREGVLTDNLAVDLYNIARVGVCLIPDQLSAFEHGTINIDYIAMQGRPLHLKGDHGFHGLIMNVHTS